MNSHINISTKRRKSSRFEGSVQIQDKCRSASFLLLLGLVVALISGGCTTLGPNSLKGERINYNLALQHTNDEQMLLNLVRLKYRDTPILLTVNSIASQFSFEVAAEAGAEFVETSTPNDIFNLGAGLAYSTRPTVTYTPLQGEEFLERFLSPISLDAISLLYRSGWTIKRLFRLTVQRLNNVKNAPRASGPTPGHAPQYEDFARVLDLLNELQRRDLLDFVYETYLSGERPPRLSMQIAESGWRAPQTLELAEILQLEKGKKHYPLTYQMVEHKQAGKFDHLMVETRSLLGMMFFLSQSVEVPERDLQAGTVTVTRHETGEAFNWSSVLGDMFRIKSRQLRPSQAAVAVHYRGNWFYVEDSDLSSKSTFFLLSQQFALQSGKVEKVVPVLTLPVGR